MKPSLRLSSDHPFFVFLIALRVAANFYPLHVIFWDGGGLVLFRLVCVVVVLLVLCCRLLVRSITPILNSLGIWWLCLVDTTGV